MIKGELWITTQGTRAEQVDTDLRRMRRFLPIPLNFTFRIAEVDDKHVYFTTVGRIYRLPVGWVKLHAEEVAGA